jgi:hypothetical protein
MRFWPVNVLLAIGVNSDKAVIYPCSDPEIIVLIPKVTPKDIHSTSSEQFSMQEILAMVIIVGPFRAKWCGENGCRVACSL